MANARNVPLDTISIHKKNAGKFQRPAEISTQKKESVSTVILAMTLTKLANALQWKLGLETLAAASSKTENATNAPQDSTSIKMDNALNNLLHAPSSILSLRFVSSAIPGILSTTKTSARNPLMILDATSSRMENV